MFISQTLTEPLILEPEDWTAAQFDTFTQIFNADGAERIVVRENAVIEAYVPEATAIRNKCRLNAKERMLDTIIADMYSREKPENIANWLKKIGIPIEDARNLIMLDENLLQKVYDVNASEQNNAGINP